MDNTDMGVFVIGLISIGIIGYFIGRIHESVIGVKKSEEDFYEILSLKHELHKLNHKSKTLRS